MYHITTEQIETFLMLAQRKNYREVSEMLFITQPTVTKYIQRLEKELNVPLFQRSTQSVELTEEGALLFETWMPLYRRFSDSIAVAQQYSQGRKKSLVIGILRDYNSERTPGDMEKGFKEYLVRNNLPDIPLSFRFLSMSEQREALRLRHIDFSFCLGFDYDTLRDVRVHTIARKKVNALLRSSHPLAGKREISIEELKDETFVIISPAESFSANHVTETMLHKFFRHPRIRIAANLQSLAYALSQEGCVTLGNRNFLSKECIDSFIEVSVAELKQAGYEETVAYPSGPLSEEQKRFLEFLGIV